MLPEAAETKALGNECMKQNKFLEALLHYTKAIKLECDDAALYSNRSLAFLKAQQYYHAKEDADKVIELKPNWTKGYFRKGEVDFAAEQFSHALVSYEKGLAINPEEKGLMEAVAKTTKALAKQRTAERNMPLYGGIVGLLFGAGLVVFDLVTSDKPVIPADILRVLVIVCVSAIGFFVTRAYRSFLRLQRASLMDPPEDLLGDISPAPPSVPSSTSPSATGARHRKGTADT